MWRYSFVILLVSLLGACLEQGVTDYGQSRDNIDNGSVESDSGFPWVVHLRSPSQDCGGTLLSPLWVLTAAHCLYNVDSTLESSQVIVSYSRTSAQGVQSGGSQTLGSSHFVIHPAYVPNQFEY